MQLAVGLLLSAGIGLSLGLIGGGGSIITVPILVYVLGVPGLRRTLAWFVVAVALFLIVRNYNAIL